MDEIRIASQPTDRFRDILDPPVLRRLADTFDLAGKALAGNTVWHVNSTAEGGGVAEMLNSILGYPRAYDLPVRWVVIDGNDAFFDVTKRLHHRLHGSPGDGGVLGAAERQIYETALAAEADRLARLIVPGDVVILHDPQTLGLAPRLAASGARIIWSCHVGADRASEHTHDAWHFLAPYTRHTAYQVFSRPQYRWDVLDPNQVVAIPPCIDTFSAKNQPLDDAAVTAILDAAGIVPARIDSAAAVFTRQGGTPGHITARARMIEETPVPSNARIVCQISRWDPLKDHAGVLTAFSRHGPVDPDAHLILAGPTPAGVSDDPEGLDTLRLVRAAWQAQPVDRRQNIHLACLPMDDVEENAAIVNALQRRSDIIVQKSLAEGFGLTVAEAMWKARPTLASKVGGIQDQIDAGISGLLVDPGDLEGVGAAMRGLLDDQRNANALGRAGQARVCEQYLAPRHLERYFRLVARVCEAA